VSTEIVSRGWALGDYRSFVMEALGAAIEASAGQGCLAWRSSTAMEAVIPGYVSRKLSTRLTTAC